MRVWLLLGVLVLSGCISEESPEHVADSNDPETPDNGNFTAPPKVDDVVVQPTPVNETGNVTIGGMLFDGAGPGGSWVVAYMPFEGMQDARFEVEWNIQASGPAFLIEPVALREELWDVPRFSPFNDQNLRMDGISDLRTGSSSYGGMTYGLFFALAAEGPWTATISYRWGDGDLIQPTWMSTGVGAEFGRGATTVIPTGSGGGDISYEAAIPGVGWTHLELLRDKAQPITVREMDFQLPGGHGKSATMTAYGYATPVGGSGSTSNGLDYLGSMADAAGTATASLQGVEGSLNMDFAHVYFPLTVLPPNLQGATYSGMLWPL